MTNQDEWKQAWKSVTIGTFVVMAPCLIPALYHVAYSEWGLVLLYAIPALCCCLFYLGLLNLFGVSDVIEMGLFAFIIAFCCAILVPLEAKVHQLNQ
jgi:hypothetical protein